MKTAENIAIVERVLQKTIPAREVQVTITITELCRFIEAGRVHEKAKKPAGQYDELRDMFGASGPRMKRSSFSDLFS